MMGGAAMVITRVAVPVPALFVAEIVARKTPVTVGVPEMRPVLVLTLSPVGSSLAP